MTAELNRAEIRAIFLKHGFTIKPGCDDLKPYVYEAAEALLTQAAQAPQAVVGAELPPPIIATRHGTPAYTVGQMLDYARAAIAADRAQQASAAAPSDLLNADEIAALRRFDECAQDGEGYDVPKAMMRRLSEIGVVQRLSGAYYHVTEFGMSVLASPAQASAAPAELIELLKAIRPNYGAVGSRDIDVTAQRKRIDRAIELLSASAAPGQAWAAVPEGWKLVPVAVTKAMQEAYFKVIDRNMQRVRTDARFGRWDSMREAYRAMLAASPEPATAAPSTIRAANAALRRIEANGPANYSGEWAASVSAGLAHDAASTAQPVEHPTDDARDAARWRFIVKDGKSISGRFTLVMAHDSGRLDELHGGEYERVIDAAMQASKGATDGAVEE